MGYFTQLARETTARVVPSRRPSWMRNELAVVHEVLSEPQRSLTLSQAVPKQTLFASVPAEAPVGRSQQNPTDNTPYTARVQPTVTAEHFPSELIRERLVEREVHEHIHHSIEARSELATNSQVSALREASSEDRGSQSITELPVRPETAAP